MTLEKSLVIIKPDSYQKEIVYKVLSEISKKGLKITRYKKVSATEEQINSHYEGLAEKLLEIHGEEKGKGIYQDILNYMQGKFHGGNRLLVIEYQGENAISVLRELVGKTNPEKADPTSIRGRYGANNNQLGAYPPLIENVIHCSDSESSSERERRIWFEN